MIEEEVRRAFMPLKNKKVGGTDGVTSEMVKNEAAVDWIWKQCMAP